jgi:hypothetical protein
MHENRSKRRRDVSPLQGEPTRGGFTAGLTAIIVGTAALCGACDEKSPSKPRTLERLEWDGLRLGMAQERAKARMKDLGWKTRCRPSPTVVFLDGDALATRWVKRSERKRTLRCDAYLPISSAKGKPGKKGGSAQKKLRAKLFFLDGTLRQMNIVLAVPDEELAPKLKKRWGAYKQLELSMYLYGSSRPGRLRALSFRRGNVTVLWLRRAKVHELIFLDHTPTRVKELRSLVTLKKGG